MVNDFEGSQWNISKPGTETFNKCDPLPFKNSGKHCLSPFHGYEAIPIVKGKCAVRYCRFQKQLKGTRQLIFKV